MAITVGYVFGITGNVHTAMRRVLMGFRRLIRSAAQCTVTLPTVTNSVHELDMMANQYGVYSTGRFDLVLLWVGRALHGLEH